MWFVDEVPLSSWEGRYEGVVQENEGWNLDWALHFGFGDRFIDFLRRVIMTVFNGNG